MNSTMTPQPWDNWEDYAAGLYQHTLREGPVLDSVKLLSHPDEFSATAREMIRAWPHAATHNLNLRTGRRAWIGQAACCYHHGASTDETREAWGRLPNTTQRAANEIAENIIDEYFTLGGCYAETLFDS